VRNDADLLDRWAGISAFDTRERAAILARSRPDAGSYISTVVVPESGAIRWLPWSGDPGHVTLWASPGAILACVTRTEHA
jgi:hypothetical protein